MHTRLLALLSRRLIIVVLLVGLCFTATSLVVFQHVHNVFAASAPYYVMVIGGQKYVAQYEGGAYNSDVTGHSIYTDFGRWDEYTVDSHGTWHWYGQFSGNENTYVNGHGQLQTGVDVTIPGVGHINTYPHEDVLKPPLTPPPAGYSVVGPEHYIGERVSVTPTQPLNLDCEVDASNVDTGHFGSGTQQFIDNGSQQAQDCTAGDNYLRRGDPGISTVFRHLTLSPRPNGSMFASLLQPQLPFPVILGIASGAFFIGSVATGNICNFASCGNTAKKILTGLAVGMGIISGVLGISANILTAMKAFAQGGAATIAAIGAEAAGDVEMTGAVSAGLASRASSQASLLSSLSEGGSISALP